jgi:hypothetical protein
MGFFAYAYLVFLLHCITKPFIRSATGTFFRNEIFMNQIQRCIGNIPSTLTTTTAINSCETVV